MATNIPRIGKAYPNSSVPKQLISNLQKVSRNLSSEHMNNHSYIHHIAEEKPLQKVTYISISRNLINKAFP